MGAGFAGWDAGQHSDLTGGGRFASVIGAAVLVLLAMDGVVNALAAVLLLPSYVGSVWFPLSAVLTGLINAALVWAAMHWAPSDRLAALPLMTWFAVIGVLILGGPGGDMMFSGIGTAILLMVCGGLPPLWVLSRRHRYQPGISPARRSSGILV
jgi:hypothetical protein